MMSYKLSANFSSNEFMCSCGCKRSFVEPRLVNGLQKLRDLLGLPIKITSGYRCIKSNEEAGGGKNSQHLYGKAADIVVPGASLKAVLGAALMVEEFEGGGIGIYPTDGFVHVDVRNGKARWGRIGKGKKAKYVSIDEALKKGKLV
jgi:uncharacterized protein YcbK (DUF882 family)